MGSGSGDASSFRAVLFDFGGVLTTSPFDNFARLEEQRGCPPGTIRRINSTNPDTNAWARLERSEITPEAFDAAFAEEAAAAGYELSGTEVLMCLITEIRPEMVAVACKLHETYTTALCTNNFLRGDSAGVSIHDQVAHCFDAIVESAVIGVRKPDPEFYRRVCETIDVAPSDCVFLDDLGINLKPAREMGMATIKVTDPSAAIAELESLLGVSLGPGE